MILKTPRVIDNSGLPRIISKEALVNSEIPLKQGPEAATLRPTTAFPLIFLLRKPHILISLLSRLHTFIRASQLNVMNPPHQVY